MPDTRVRRSALVPLLPLARLVAAAAVAWAAPDAVAAPPASCPAGMVRVEGGTRARDGERVRVSSFCLDRTEVTVAAYAACAEVGACKATHLECGNAATWGEKGLAAHPVNCVDWYEADTFCREHGKRLPAEEEWEWAAQGGGRDRAFPWGDASPGDRACWDGEGNAKGKGMRKGTCPVGAHARGKSRDGVQDLAGNVREWTATGHERFRVLRGGSWGDTLPEFLSASFRGWNAPDERMELLGFRCAAPLGAVAHAPRRHVQTARAEIDDAGVMIFSEPIEVGPRRAGRR